MPSTGQITFYRKNHIDLDRPNPILSVTDSVAIEDGSASLQFLRNRNNNSGWITSGSDDTANTELLIDLKDFQDVDQVMLVKHNFKDYLVEYWDGAAFQLYVDTVGDIKDTTILDNPVNTSKLRITIYTTQVTDADKTLRQLIVAEKFGSGAFEGWPIIKNPKTSLNKRKNKMLSGKTNIVEKRGFFSCELNVKFLGIDGDLEMIEDIYFQREGVLMLLSGGDEDQFRNKRIGYRNEDIILVRPVDELNLPYAQGVYANGIKLKMKLEEVVF